MDRLNDRVRRCILMMPTAIGVRLARLNRIMKFGSKNPQRIGAAGFSGHQHPAGSRRCMECWADGVLPMGLSILDSFFHVDAADLRSFCHG
jgi:hypothetical protein